MEKRYFSLEIRDENHLTRIFLIILGLLCCSIAIFWGIYNLKSVKEYGTLWITIAFLFSFGVFQIFSGFGLATKFIELSDNKIRLKRYSLLPAIDLPADQIEKIELFPLKVLFFYRYSNRILLRFGISNPEKVELIKAEIVHFSDYNRLNLEIKDEEI